MGDGLSLHGLAHGMDDVQVGYDFFFFFLAWKITSFVGTNRFEFLFRGQNDLTSLYLNELISFFYLVFYIMSVALYDIILYYIMGGVF